MKMDEATIEKHLRQTPLPVPPAELYDRLRADLPSNDSPLDCHSTVLPKVWIRRLATISLLLTTMIATGAGIYRLTHPRVWRSELVPGERLRDLAEPYIPHEEDLKPIPLALHENIVSMMQQAEQHRANTGQKTRWSLFDIQPDGRAFWWTDGRYEIWAATGFKTHANEHPNDFRAFWLYNLDGSPVLIKEVTPHYDEQWKPGEVRDDGMPVSDGFNDKKGYLVQLNQPKSDMIIGRTLLLERVWAKPVGQQWKIELKGVQMGGDEYVFMAVKLPAGTKVVEASRPFTREDHDIDGRQTLWFDEALGKRGHVQPLTITYAKE